MDGIGTEVSHKIRAAIKAKLVELGAYIDDELPDYIMVMVANKRSRQQMDEDLLLFLGSNTKTFTSWLYTVLQRLQEVTVANSDSKKEGQKSKGEKRKHPSSDSEEGDEKEGKSLGEEDKTSKKHVKKEKDDEKLKKPKYKSKGKEKEKNMEDKEASVESEGDDKEKKSGADKEAELPNAEPDTSPDGKNDDKDEEGQNKQKLSDSSVPKVSENVDNTSSEYEGSSTESTSPSRYWNELAKKRSANEDGKMEDTEDGFNIETLKEAEDQMLNEKFIDKSRTPAFDPEFLSTGMLIKAPTKELLKEHNKIISQTEAIIARNKRLLSFRCATALGEIKRSVPSRRKKIVKKRQMPGKKKLNSPFAEAQPSSSGNKEQATFPSHRAKRISRRRDHDVDEDERIYNREGLKSNPFGEKNYSPKGKNEGESSRSGMPSTSGPKSNIISISKSLEMEKNLGVAKKVLRRSTRETSAPKKKPVSSRVCAVPKPETPEIPSIVKVKPRQFAPKDKQANKVLILKAVADAEKSIATVHTRNDNEIEAKKPGLFTKKLRSKRYEKLAVTLSNVKGGAGVVDRAKSKRVVSLDSENANARDRKTESLKDSELSQGFRSIPELAMKNISYKSEDQFISCRTSAMEKNDKYIHCWLEGVEKAVKNEEIVNPSDVDDFRISFSDEAGREEFYCSSSSEDEEMLQNIKSVKAKYNSITNANANAKPKEEEGSKIVVTLDGLTSRTIKDIILKNRDTPNGPLLSSEGNQSDLNDNLDETEEETEKKTRSQYKESDPSKDAGTSKQSGSGIVDSSFEKISERFGRINKTSENHEFKEKYYEFERERYEKKCLEYQGTDKEKHYEKLKDKYASTGESKNKKLIARLSEKFGKVDREFEDKKRKYSGDDLRHSYYKRVDRSTEREAKYNKRDRRSLRSGWYKY